MTPILETSRLILRPLELADADEVQLLFPQWEVVRYLASQVPWPYPSDGAYMFYRDVALRCPLSPAERLGIGPCALKALPTASLEASL